MRLEANLVHVRQYNHLEQVVSHDQYEGQRILEHLALHDVVLVVFAQLVAEIVKCLRAVGGVVIKFL